MWELLEPAPEILVDEVLLVEGVCDAVVPSDIGELDVLFDESETDGVKSSDIHLLRIEIDTVVFELT